MRLPALLTALFYVTAAVSFAAENASIGTTPAAAKPIVSNEPSPKAVTPAAASNSWKALLLPREDIPDERNALVRWRKSFDKLQPDTVETSQLLQNLSSPIEDLLGLADPTLRKWLLDVTPTVNDLVLRDGEQLQLPALRGPETPFPDHAPLIQLATVRVALMKAAWLDGRPDEALALAVDNLRLARAFLGSQEALIAVIQAAGVWQISLDGVYWLARQEKLTPEAAARLQSELLTDERLASTALIRAFRSEFTFFTHLVIERLPKTHDVNLILSGISTLGMKPPEPTDTTQPHLAIAEREPFDRDATLQLSADDISGWITAFKKNRHPRGLSSRHTGPQLQAYAKEIEPLLRYATDDIPDTPENIAKVNQTIASVENPVGKLFLIITTSQWEPLSMHVFRREAERSALVGLLAQRRQTSPAPSPAPSLSKSTTDNPAQAASSSLATPATPAQSQSAAQTAPTNPTNPANLAESPEPTDTAGPALTAESITATRFATWEKLVAAKLLQAPPADPFTTDAALHLDLDPLQPRIWSVGENGIDDGGQGSGENVGRPLDLTWPMR